MSDFSIAQPGLPAGLNTRSMGVKLIVVSVLALLMTIPAFFVGSLVDDRSQGAENAVQQSAAHAGGQQTIPGSSIKLVDSY